MRQSADILAVGVHDVQLVRVGIVAVGAKDDVLAVGRVASLGIVAGGIGQPFQVAAVGIGLKDVHVRVEVPLVTAALPLLLLATAVFVGLLLPGIGIEMAAG